MIRSLKGALVNDFYLFFSKINVIVLIVILIMPFAYVIFGGVMVSLSAQIFIIAVIPQFSTEITTLTVTRKWKTFEHSFPTSPAYFILSRDIFFLISCVISVALWYVISFGPLHMGYNYLYVFNFAFLLTHFTKILIELSMSLLNPKKKGTVYGISISTSIISVLIIFRFMPNIFFEPLNFRVAIPVIILLHVISAIISVLFRKLNLRRAT